ncbi:HAD family hydrolase [Cryptosporangium minutisporangium]|uniref:HAD family hydrolase n=1 Tax=Cryptosporangium minutisporangium TaxID=113569 RepID=A0ABP6SV53_9ACTN
MIALALAHDTLEAVDEHPTDDSDQSQWPDTDPKQLDVLLSEPRRILLSFDGPVCDLFPGRSAPTVVDDLRLLVTNLGMTLPNAFDRVTDPHEYFRWAASSRHPDLPHLVDQMLTAAELRAAVTAEPTPGVIDFLHACQTSGRTVAIISTRTSGEAVKSLLARFGLTRLVSDIAGRHHPTAGSSEPVKTPVWRLLRTLNTEATHAVLIGGSDTDIRAAHFAGIRSIGYAPNPDKKKLLAGARPTMIVAAMEVLTGRP